MSFHNEKQPHSYENPVQIPIPELQPAPHWHYGHIQSRTPTYGDAIAWRGSAIGLSSKREGGQAVLFSWFHVQGPEHMQTVTMPRQVYSWAHCNKKLGAIKLKSLKNKRNGSILQSNKQSHMVISSICIQAPCTNSSNTCFFQLFPFSDCSVCERPSYTCDL